MDAKSRFIKEAGFDIDEDFVEGIQGLDVRTGIKVAKFIQGKVKSVHSNTLVSTVLGGVVVDDNDNPITFAVEIIKDNSPNIILSDLSIIDMNEYLDLLNLNKKSNEKRKNKRPKKDS